MEPIQSLIPIIMFILDGASSSVNPSPNSDALESTMMQKLELVTTDTDFSFITEANNGRQFSYNVGSSTPDTSYESASTSKWVTGAIVLWYAQQGSISLSSKPQDFLDYWPNTGSLSNITVEQLLSFTSGLNNAPPCVFLANADYLTCVERILEVNESINEPGSEFYYGPSHMQVVGAMLIEALGVNSWAEVFTDFKTETGLFSNSSYSKPSLTNPRLAGGMEWTANDYMGFLRALYRGNLLATTYRNALFADQLETASIVLSPSINDLNEDWHYAQGVWLECRATVFNCNAPFRFSSPGSFGAYPFIDFENNYFGIVARQGETSTSEEGVLLFREVDAELSQWSQLNN